MSEGGVTVRQPQGFEGLELMDVDRVNQSLASQVLTTYIFSITPNTGAGTVSYKRERLRMIERGWDGFATYQPGEVLSAQPSSAEGYSFRAIYMSETAMQSLLQNSNRRALPVFARGLHDGSAQTAHLMRRVGHTFNALAHGPDALERESALMQMVEQLTRYAAERHPFERDLQTEHHAVELVKDYLRERHSQDPSLNELAALTGLNKYHVLQVFKRAVGVSPHQYLTSYRVHQAKRLIQRGSPIAQVALETGFVDQAHFSRVFKKHAMVTPGAYQKAYLS
jgi:AraC-like DNA-binding protein